MEDLRDHEFTIIDVETTGLSTWNGDRVIEAAAVKVRNDKITDRFETFVDPQRELSYDAFLVNGISNEMLTGAPKARDVLPGLTAFIGGSTLIGHNLKFDLGFINNELSLSGMKPLDGNPTMDTVKMARGLVPGLPSYSLSSLAFQLGVTTPQEHRAMADVLMTHRVFGELMEIALQKKFTTLEQLFLLFGTKRRTRQTKQNKLRTIQEAIDREQKLDLIYAGQASGASTRVVTPKEIQGQGRQAMLVAHCHLRKAERNFVVDKIVKLEMVPER